MVYMISKDLSKRFYIPEGATREVPYNGSFIQVTNLVETGEIIPPWYEIIAGESTVEGRRVLVGVALASGIRSIGSNGREFGCGPIRTSETEEVKERLGRYRAKTKRGDIEDIIVIPLLSEI